MPDPFEFRAAVAMGAFPGYARQVGFGERDNVGNTAAGEDVWPGTATTIPIPDQANGEQMTLVSSSANDAAAGTGVRQVYIHYLDVNGDEQSEIVTMNGLVPVNTVATNIRFIQAIHSHTVGSALIAQGNISIYRMGDAARVYATIQAQHNQCLTISKMVPAGKTLYLTGWGCAAAGSKRVTLRLRSTDHHGQLYDGNTRLFLFKDTAVLQDSTHTKRFDPPLAVPALSIVKVTAYGPVAGAAVSASFEGFQAPA